MAKPKKKAPKKKAPKKKAKRSACSLELSKRAKSQPRHGAGAKGKKGGRFK